MTKYGFILTTSLALTGCQSHGSILPVNSGTTPTGTFNPTSGTDTVTTTTTTATTTTTNEILCETPPPTPQGYDTIWGIPTSEEFTFDADGNLLNINDSDDLLYRSNIMGSTEVLTPYSSSEVGAIRFLNDGDLVVADEGNGALIRLGLDGSSEVLLGSIPEPNSISVHPDGWIFTTAGHQIWRVDPNAIQPAEMMFELPGHDLDGVTFSPDFDWMYFNSDDQGRVYKAEVTADIRLNAPLEIVDLEEGWSELDGMTVDECGWIYVTFTDGRIKRVDPHIGVVQDFIDIPGGWTTSIHFGSGAGGWAQDHVYVMDRSGGIYDIEVGINGK
ncbi:MAG: hypothetical protein GWP91_22010 [Rhodobacterales bacterium]|nr:hypothetical protein [Rhodobacterales bacterium]